MSQLSQRKIAEAMGVSVMTVSRALRNHPDLATDTKARIVKMAREMGYTSPKTEVDLKKEVRRLAVIAYERRGALGTTLDSDVQRTIFLALQRECQAHGVEIVIELATSGQVPLSLANRTVESAFIFGRYTHDDVMVEDGIPKLAISSYIEDNPLSHVVADNAAGMRLVTEYLFTLGHRKIVFLGYKDAMTELYQERADGYTAAMVRAGLTPQVHLSNEFATSDPLEIIAGNTAVVASSDSLAYELIDMVGKRGVRVPEDLSIVGFDNMYELCRTNRPKPVMAVTSYGPDWALMGKLAARMLLFRADDLQGSPIRITVPGRVVTGQSTAKVNNH
jgi:DNA-binding LacI/PurR family transcriptional regulator